MGEVQDPRELQYYRYTAAHDGTTSDGRVCRFEKDARDRLFKDAGLVKEVAKSVAADVPCAYVFDPAIDIKPGWIITIRE